MKIELIENKVYFNNGSEKKEIHPFWLRERVNGEQYLDKGTQQRLFDPTFRWSANWVPSASEKNRSPRNREFHDWSEIVIRQGGLWFNRKKRTEIDRFG